MSWPTEQADPGPAAILLTATEFVTYLTFHGGTASGMTPLHAQAVERDGYRQSLTLSIFSMKSAPKLCQYKYNTS